MKSIFSLLFLFTFLAIGCAQKEVPTNQFVGQEKEIHQLIESYHASGVAVAIIKNGKVVYQKGFGYRNYGEKLKVDANTVFGIGSVTKSFTASLVGILEDERLLSINNSPRKYLENLEFYNDDMNEKVTMHHILNHATGISNMSSESSSILFRASNPKDIIPKLKYLPPSNTVGKELMYNNMMYGLSSLVVEKITGKSWEKNIKQRIFKPLKMNNSYTSYKSAIKNKNLAFGYAVDSIIPSRVLSENIPINAPAGSIFSSVNDMTKWMKVWMNEEGQILSKEYIKKATESYLEFPSGNDSILPKPYYGYGWLIREYDDGLKRVEHSGGVSGYTSNLVMFPKEKTGIVVLTNQSNSSLAFAVTDIFLKKLTNKKTNVHPIGYSQKNIVTPNTPTVINQKNKPTYSLNDLVGKYHHPGYGEFTISYDGTTLYADFPFTKFRLVHDGGDTFLDRFAEEIPLMMWNFMRFEFIKNKKGQIDGVNLNFDRDGVFFKRINNHK